MSEFWHMQWCSGGDNFSFKGFRFVILQKTNETECVCVCVCVCEWVNVASFVKGFEWSVDRSIYHLPFSLIYSKDFGTGPRGAQRNSFSSSLNWSEAGSRRGESSRPLPGSLFSAACAFKHTRNFPAALGSARHRPLSLRLHRRADWPTALIRVLSAICRTYWTSGVGSLEASSSRTMQAIKCVVVGDG